MRLGVPAKLAHGVLKFVNGTWRVEQNSPSWKTDSWPSSPRHSQNTKYLGWFFTMPEVQDAIHFALSVGGKQQPVFFISIRSSPKLKELVSSPFFKFHLFVPFRLPGLAISAFSFGHPIWPPSGFHALPRPRWGFFTSEHVPLRRHAYNIDLTRTLRMPDSSNLAPACSFAIHFSDLKT